MKSQGMVGNCSWQLFDIVWLIFPVRQINSFAAVDLHSHNASPLRVCSKIYRNICINIFI